MCSSSATYNNNNGNGYGQQCCWSKTNRIGIGNGIGNKLEKVSQKAKCVCEMKRGAFKVGAYLALNWMSLG